MSEVCRALYKKAGWYLAAALALALAGIVSGKFGPKKWAGLLFPALLCVFVALFFLILALLAQFGPASVRAHLQKDPNREAYERLFAEGRRRWPITIDDRLENRRGRSVGCPERGYQRKLLGNRREKGYDT
jgi:hypothetical protein